MGLAARWCRRLWSGSKENKSPCRDSSSYGGAGEERTEKKRWSFRKARDSGYASSSGGQDASTAAAIEVARFKSFYAVSEKAQSKHAIAVDAASATVTAAEAAVAIVRLAGNGVIELAAVRIQTAFRAYLVYRTLH